MTETTDTYQAFQQLFYRQYAPLCGYAARLLNNSQDAEDLVQELFIKLWQTRPDLLQSEEVQYYLYTATRNNCISHIRKRNSSLLTDIEPEDLGHLPDEITPAAPGKDLQELVTAALGQLPPQCQLIFRMSRFGKMIADELGLSIKTVENQMGKALRILRQYIRANPVNGLVLLELLWALIR
jgi:RNA polymerase sigma-70 factor (family 1)